MPPGYSIKQMKALNCKYFEVSTLVLTLDVSGVNINMLKDNAADSQHDPCVDI